MKPGRYLPRLLLCVALTSVLLPAARAGDAAPGAIVGLVTNATKLAVAHATVTAVRSDAGAIRATVSGSDGLYAFADLPPGAWAVTVETPGSAPVTTPILTVVAGKATRYDIVMNLAGPQPPRTLAAMIRESLRF